MSPYLLYLARTRVLPMHVFHEFMCYYRRYGR